MDSLLVSENFSRHANEYEMNAIVQKQVADDLVQRISGDYSSVLDIGCGTGYLAEKVFEKTGAEVTGIDISSGMIAQAQAIRPCFDFICMSAEDALKDVCDVDLMVSSFSLHWLNNLPDFLLKSIDKASIAYSFPVDGSLQSLADAYSCAYEELGLESENHIVDFPKIEEITKFILGDNKGISIYNKDYSVRYPSPLTALKAIKSIGGNYSTKHLGVGLAKKLFSILSREDDSFFITWKIMTVIHSKTT